jgi:NAD(P)-dependent dehydrogenase (short-subunit alcohol dehydrogenase family)
VEWAAISGARCLRARRVGREVALQLAAHGCAVGLADLNAIATADTAALARERGGQVLEIVDDLTREGAREPAMETMVRRWGGIDILVNNAGYGVIEPFIESTYASWNRALALRPPRSPWHARPPVASCASRAPGASSTSPRPALPDYTAYTASKAGVDSITRALAVAMALSGVQVVGHRSPIAVATGQMMPGDQALTRSTISKPRLVIVGTFSVPPSRSSNLRTARRPMS